MVLILRRAAAVKPIFLRANALLLLVAAFAAAANLHYVFSPAGSFPGAYQTVPLANSLGEIAGLYETTTGGAAYIETLGEERTRTPFLSLAPPGSTPGTPYASAINAAGVVAGGYCGPGTCTYPQSQHGFTWSNGNFTTFDYPGASSTAVYGINDPVQIVGGFCVKSPICGSAFGVATDHGFLDAHGTLTQLDYPGAQSTQANAINNAGTIVGIYNVNNSGPQGFLLQSGVYTNIDYPAATMTYPKAINNHGVVAGHYQDINFNVHGFLYQNGKFMTVDHPNTPETVISGINDHDIIVGNWGNSYLPIKGIPIR
jgi:probable HAF family extracellular repeat protein